MYTTTIQNRGAFNTMRPSPSIKVEHMLTRHMMECKSDPNRMQRQWLPPPVTNIQSQGKDQNQNPIIPSDGTRIVANASVIDWEEEAVLCAPILRRTNVGFAIRKNADNTISFTELNEEDDPSAITIPVEDPRSPFKRVRETVTDDESDPEMEARSHRDPTCAPQVGGGGKTKPMSKKRKLDKRQGEKRSELAALKRQVQQLATRGPIYETRSLPKAKPDRSSHGLHPAESRLIHSFLHPTDKSRPKHGLFSMPHDDSHKSRGFTEIDFAVGTAGFGFIMLSSATASDQVAIYYSTAAYTGTVTATSGTGVAFASLNNLPYLGSSLGAPNLLARQVCMGTHVTYSGLNQNRGGICYGFSDPDHATLVGAGVSTITARKQCSISTIKENSVFHVSLNPYLEADLSYSTSAAPYGQPSAALLFTSTAGNTFHASCVGDVEYIGTLTEGIAQANPLVHSDITRNCVNAVTKAKELHATVPDARPSDLANKASTLMQSVTHAERKTVNTVRKSRTTGRKIFNSFKTMSRIGEEVAPEMMMF
jgi:hypothetical protein